MRVDMSNIAFGRNVYERLPLPPATATIGSDYFLIHAVYDAALPGVLHNRHIENYYTGERRTHAGFLAYQTRFVKFLLSMLYLHHVYDRMAEAGDTLLRRQRAAGPGAVRRLPRRERDAGPYGERAAAGHGRGGVRTLGGKYAEFARGMAAERERLLDEAARDTEDFVLLIRSWGALVRASGDVEVRSVPR